MVSERTERSMRLFFELSLLFVVWTISFVGFHEHFAAMALVSAFVFCGILSAVMFHLQWGSGGGQKDKEPAATAFSHQE